MSSVARAPRRDTRLLKQMVLAAVTVLLGAAVGTTLVGWVPMRVGVVLLGLFVGLVLTLFLQRNIFAGVIILIVYGSLFGAAKKIIPEVPLGVGVEGLAALLVLFVASRKIVMEKSTLYISWLSLLVTLFLLVVASEFLNVTESSFSNSIFGFRFTAVPIVMYFVGMATIQSRRRAVVLVLCMLAVGSLVGIYAAVQFFIGPLGFEQTWLQSSATPNFYIADQVRAYGTMDDAGSLATYAQMLVVLAWTLTLPYFPTRLRLIGLPLLVLNGLGLALAFARASWMGAAIGIFLVTFWPDRHLLRKLAQVALLGILALVMVLAADQVMPSDASLQKVWTERMGPLLQNIAAGTLGEEGSVKERLGVWSDSVPLVLRQPFGIGLGTTGGVGGRFDSKKASIAADNYYVKLMIETGLAGVLLFMAILILAVGKGARLAHRARDEQVRALALGTTGILLGLAATAVFNVVLDFVPASYYFWLLLGALAGLEGRAITDQERSPS